MQGPGAVGEVDGFVVGNLALEAVPEDLQPAVTEGAERGVVVLAAVALPVVGVLSLAQAERRRLAKAHWWTASARWRLQASRRVMRSSRLPERRVTGAWPP